MSTRDIRARAEELLSAALRAAQRKAMGLVARQLASFYEAIAELQMRDGAESVVWANEPLDEIIRAIRAKRTTGVEDGATKENA